jgi:hypothetical protein
LRECRAIAGFDAAECPSRFNAPLTARERRADGFLRVWLALMSRFARFRVDAEAVPFFGAGSFTPARRASESPIAIACSVDRAPCFPSRMWSISSRTNSPACVDGDFPSRLSRCARRIVSFDGIS